MVVKGTLVAMIRGVATDAVSAILYKLPSRIRNVVQTVTTDLSSAMMLTVRKSIPKGYTHQRPFPCAAAYV